MRLFLLAALLGLGQAAGAQTTPTALPPFYKHVSRLIWVVHDLSRSAGAWSQLGLHEVQNRGELRIRGTVHGRPAEIRARALSATLGPDLQVEMLQPEGSGNALAEFSRRHGEGIFAVVYDVPDSATLARETTRLESAGAAVLETLELPSPHGPVHYTFFDTEAGGKYVLGLATAAHGPAAPRSSEAATISHLAPVIYPRDSEAVSRFWQRLGFPPLSMEHATPREDSRYRGEPLLLTFDVGWQRFSQLTMEWIIPPQEPANIYADFLRVHGEGIQHIGMPVPDLPSAIHRFEQLGYHVWQSGAWGDVGKPDSGQYAYMDTDAIGGISVELIHAY